MLPLNPLATNRLSALPVVLLCFCVCPLGCNPGSGNEAYEIGIDFFEDQQYAKAVSFITKALEVDGGLPLAHYYRGVSYLRLNKFDEALADLTVAIEENPQHADAYAHRSNAFYELEQYEKAFADADQAVQLEPENGLAYLMRGQARLELGQMDQAVSDLGRQLQLQPEGDRARAYVGLGAAYMAKGDYQEAKFNLDRAVKAYEDAMRRNPKHQTTDTQRGKVWRGKETYDAAAEAYVSRGDLWLLQNNPQQALQDYTRAVNAAEDRPKGYLRRSSLYRQRNNCFGAARDLERLIEIEPDLPVAHAALAWVLATCPEERNRDEWNALQHAKKALELAGANVKPFYLEALAAAYAEAENFSAAVEQQQAAIDLAGEDTDRDEMQERLKLYQVDQPYRDTTQEARW